VIAVLASRHDLSARALVDAIGQQGASGLLTARDLSVAGWRHWVAGSPEWAVIEGSPVPVDQLQAVIVRLPAVTADELPDIAPADRPYVAAEMTSLLQSWLDALPCRVYNRPGGAHLCGPGWRPEQWTRCAWRLGIPAEPIVRHHRLMENADRVAADGPFEVVTVLGERCVGAADGHLRDWARLLTQAAGVLWLGVYFRAGRFVAADGVPDLSTEELRAALLESIAA
jgi:hypothetical protein